MLTGSKGFSKLDLSHAYAQLNVDKESQEYLTINTHKGLYSYTKLPYGVKSTPKIFQSKMDQILQGIEKCVCKQDDILIGGNDWRENLKILGESKCEFLKPEVVYLGLKINEKGLHPVEEKVDAVRKAPVPSNVSELRSFLGMVQYYHSFLPNLATTLAPLHKLLKKDVQWKSTSECQKAYDVCKQSLTSDTLLVHYDLNRKLRLSCDASSYGLDAVLSHVMDDGQERPIAYASRTLSQTEKNYAQIERCHIKVGSESAIYQVSAIDDDFPITAKDIGKATKVDSVLCKVYYYVMSGWPENCQDENLRPYHNRKLELSCEQDCVLWGSRVVIPPVCREKMHAQ
ncbi:Hypothetical predicted protein [Paramuricea clavata]|uniref:Uncharacterized protein n=1 Tax=Paramuricea clavata TaxID=317549 RepID=A0A7D9DE04_PARCT|nr:Hypothetical predicted protein [Paramuricea clavata]